MTSWNEKLINAARDGSLTDLKRFIEKGADLEYRGKDSYTPLLIAVFYGHLDTVQYLVSVGCNVEVRTKDDFTPLLIAVQQGYLEIVTYLIKANCNREARTKLGSTPLIIAAQKGNLQIVQYLISVGCERDSQNNDEFTPLLFAVQLGYIEIVKFLVTAQCDIETRDKLGRTPLFIAVQKGNLQIVQYLISVGCERDARENISREIKKEFNQPREKLQLRPSISNTHKLPDHIGNQTFQLGIELGLSVVEMQQIENDHVTNLRSQTEEVLNKWRILPEATYEVLAKALHRLQLSSVLSYLTYEEDLEEQMEVGLAEKVKEELQEQVEEGVKEEVKEGSQEQVEVGLKEEVANRIIHDIQNSQILDYMITHLVISSDDRRRIEQHAGQDDQNRALLREVIKRGEPTYTLFIDALRTSGYTDLANELKSDSQEQGSSTAIVQNENIENQGLSNWTVPMYKVRLQKNYSNIIDSIQHEQIVDHLISRDVLTIAESQMINACPAQIQKNRKLMDILLHGSEHAFIEFLKALRKDSVYAELADKIEHTTVAYSKPLKRKRKFVIESDSDDE